MMIDRSQMPTRIYLKGSNNFIIVSETLDEVLEKIHRVKHPLDTIIFYDNENRYSVDRRVVVVAEHIDYCKPERVSI